MQRVKDFVEHFLDLEAKIREENHKTYFAESTQALDTYNDTLDKFHACLIPSMKNHQGYLPRTELETNPMVLDMMRKQGSLEANPRHFFKLTQYHHNKHGAVWVAYVSGRNPHLDYKPLGYCFIIVERKGALKIAKEMVYSDHEWEELHGLKSLTLKALSKGKVEEIERYTQPADKRGGLQIYQSEC